MNKQQLNLFGQRLLELRKSKDLTQKSLSEISGIQRVTIAKYETSERTPTLEHILFFANFFDTSADYLLGLSDTSSTNIEDKTISQKTGMSEKEINSIKALNDSYTHSERYIFKCLCENNLMCNLLGSISAFIDIAEDYDETIFNIDEEIEKEKRIDFDINEEAAADGYGSDREKIKELEAEKKELSEKVEIAKISSLSKIKTVLDELYDNYQRWLW